MRQIEEIGERKLIAHLQGKIRVNNSFVLKGIGDDSAIIRTDPGRLLLVSTDSLIEGIHFKQEFATSFQIGWKSLAHSLSDIAAMGGTPLHCLISLILPSSTPFSFFDGFFDGVKSLAAEYGVNIVGGNLAEGRDGIVINLTTLGEVEEGSFSLRSSAKVGDKILVTGTLGDSAAGLKVLEEELYEESWDELIHKHLTPKPPLREGALLGKIATSMIDLSDGLTSDLINILDESQVGARLYLQALPISQATKEVAKRMNFDPFELALKGGEDYELLFTLPAERLSVLEELPLKCNVIGEIKPYQEGKRLMMEDGEEVEFAEWGYEHFRGRRK